MNPGYVNKAIAALSLVMLASSVTFAQPYPHYDEESLELTVPAIDYNGQSAHFQDATLELGSDNLWQLKDVYEARLNDSIEQVELIKTDTVPVQILLRISGVYYHGCARTGQIHIRFENNQFSVSSFYENNLWVKTPETVLCTANVTDFSFVHPLPVYGLQAGTYEYNVNGKFSGSFTLDTHNVFNP